MIVKIININILNLEYSVYNSVVENIQNIFKKFNVYHNVWKIMFIQKMDIYVIILVIIILMNNKINNV